MRRYLANFFFPIFILCVIYFTKHQVILYQKIPCHDVDMQRSEKKEIIDFNISSQFQQKILNYAKNDSIIITLTDYFYLDLALNFHHSLQKFNVGNYLIACMHRKACEELEERHIQ